MYAFAKHMQDQLQVEHLLERLTSEQAHVIVVVLEETEDFGKSTAWATARRSRSAYSSQPCIA